MADIDQKAGWWVASDGAWYPPELHPSRRSPQWGEGPKGPTSSPRTNGFAIASLVLSLTVFFIGPILAIIFGVIARRQIRESRGTQGGDGLALAGLIIGIVALSLSLVIGTVVIVLIANGSVSRIGQHELAISGAPGYTTTTGETGLPLASGSPWGRPCQPVVFQVSPSMPTRQYDLIQQAVDNARALGVDVTIETPKLLWYPSLLYPVGQTNASIQLVPIVPSMQPPPSLSDGHVERIGFGWDTKISSDGRHDVLSDLQATIYLSAVRGDPQATERATRQLVAFSQGVAGSTSPGSSIAQGNTKDAYSRRDVVAMQLMSGCTFQPTTQPGPPQS
jgi:hypothetical protein